MAHHTPDLPVPLRILRRIRAWGRGKVFVTRDCFDLGSRGAIDVALHRLAKAGEVRRLARGVYDYPQLHALWGPVSPSLDDVARALARSTSTSIAASGAVAANALGLSSQVPARPVYLTNGPSRAVRVGNRTIRFVHASPSRRLGGDSLAGLVVRALRHIGREGITDDVIRHLHSLLGERDRMELRELRADVPAWLRAWLDTLVSHDPARAA